MDIRYKLYPYPVLSSFSNDYIGCSFISNIQVVRDIQDIVIKMNVIMNNAELQNLIDLNKAEYLFHIECSQTSYRYVLKTCDTENIKRISESKLNGKVSICSFIVAKEDIHNYTNSKFNEDYGNMMFNISKGSILGIGGQTNIDIIKEMDEMSKIPSIFSILRRDVDNNEGMQIDINGEKIKIWLSNEDFYNYKSICNMPSYLPVIHSMIIMPTLLYAFETLKQNGTDEYESYRWYKSIDRILKKSELSLDSDILEDIPTYQLSQKLLGLPIKRALSSMIDIGMEDEEI
jgi:hypothetical protein